MEKSTSVQIKLAGFGSELDGYQSEMFAECNTAAGQGGIKFKLIEDKPLKSDWRDTPLFGGMVA